MNVVGRNLMTLKEQRDTTQSAIAAVAGATDGAASKWFSGEKMPRLKYLERIADYYMVSLDDLTSEAHGLYAKAHGLTDAPPGATAVAPSPARMVPVRVLGAAHAGDPDEPWELDGEAMFYEDMASRHPNCYALRVNGSCMDRVFTGQEYVYVDPDMEPRDGSIAVMLIDGLAEVRRVKMGVGFSVISPGETQPQAIAPTHGPNGAPSCLGFARMPPSAWSCGTVRNVTTARESST